MIHPTKHILRSKPCSGPGPLYSPNSLSPVRNGSVGNRARGPGGRDIRAVRPCPHNALHSAGCPVGRRARCQGHAMIHEITANQTSFRPIRLKPGLNVILADRTEGSSRRDTRNGLGKSTLVEIIHFCLGAQIRSGRGLAIPALAEWAFTMDVSLADERITVTRALAEPNIVTVSGLGEDWSDIPQVNLMGERSFTQMQWRAFLGKALFSLPTTKAPKYNPSFRSLISYFVRRGHHAFGDPFSHFRNQRTWDVQLHVALLLGLEWNHAVQWQRIKDRDTDLKEPPQARGRRRRALRRWQHRRA